MSILFLARATLFKVFGGDTIQIVSTAKYLRKLGFSVDIKLSDDTIDYSKYDLLHIFNIGRPADALVHIRRSGLPYVVSTIFLDYSEYQRQNNGIRSALAKFLSPDQIEYLKAIARFIKNNEKIQSIEYLFYGHRKSVRQIAAGASFILPNSESEYERLVRHYKICNRHKVVYNGIDTEVFYTPPEHVVARDPLQVLCVARIEGNKNQLNLIKALNDTKFTLKLIGKPAPNHLSYYNECRKIAAGNVSFQDFMPQEQLIEEYLSAKVHILPSWNETTGLSSLEAAYCGCNIVITDKGDTVEYFGDQAWYCDPGDTKSIYSAIVNASEAPANGRLCEKIAGTYNWRQAAMSTGAVYEEILKIKRLITSNELQEVE